MRSRAVLIVASMLLLAGCAGYVSVRSTPDADPAPAREPRPAPASSGHQGPPPHAAHLGIPPGHLPPPGRCRIWIPGKPPGHQPAPGVCSVLEDRVPPGAWLVYRPTEDRDHVRVSVYDEHRAGYQVSILLYEVDSGRFVREE